MISNWIHPKNSDAFMDYNINIEVTNDSNLNNINLNKFDVVYSPSHPININKYPNTKFIFGPHFSVFPEANHMDMIRGINSVYIQPSKWACDVWRENILCKNIRLEVLPFRVDSKKFNEIKPLKEREKVFIYFKNRNPNELSIIYNFLIKKGYLPKIFNYERRYDEREYIEYLHNSKFGVWIGRHESQGFALEEALSCNVPLLVWDVTSMNQEFGINYPDIKATAIPYWDSRCGEYFTNISQLETTYSKFISRLDNYMPRQYILNNLTREICENRLREIVDSIILYNREL